MQRRKFLQKSISAGVVLPSLLNGFSVKAFVPDSALLAPTTETDYVLVLVQLNGGNDGVNTVIPLEYFTQYQNARSNIFIPQNKVLNLAGTQKIGFHPSMTGLQSLFNEGWLNVVQSVGYPQPNFSHFRATDIWMSASDSNQVISSGWAGRYLNYEYPNFPNGYPNSSMTDPLAIQIGSVSSMVLQGPQTNMGMSITNPTNFYNFLTGVQDPVPNTPAGKELSYIRTVANQTQQFATVIKNAANAVNQQATYPTNNTLADQLKIVARLIKGGLKTRVYMVSMGGFDTHAAQVNTTDTTTGTHATLLQRVSDAIKAFTDDLKFLKIEDRVMGMTFSEFGRRIKSNASNGTDHGAAAPLFVFGKNAIGGVTGNTPIIPATSTVNDNVPYQYDFRSIYTNLLSQWLCIDAAALPQIMLKSFQPVSLVKNTACIKVSPNLSGATLITNNPNPFTSSTIISYTSGGGHTLVQILDTMGRVIKNLVDATLAPGNYTVLFNASNLHNGVYYARLQNMAVQQVKAMVKGG